jgi:hypothetical protein
MYVEEVTSPSTIVKNYKSFERPQLSMSTMFSYLKCIWEKGCEGTLPYQHAC